MIDGGSCSDHGCLPQVFEYYDALNTTDPKTQRKQGRRLSLRCKTSSTNSITFSYRFGCIANSI